MLIVLVPVACLAAAAAAHWSTSKKSGPPRGSLTAERKHIFETAMQSERDPDKLRALARAYDDQGLPGQATLLRKRAALRELPPALKAARREAYRKGMASKDPDGVEGLAREFQTAGAIAAAKSLREYARGLRAARTVPALTLTPEQIAVMPKPEAEKPVEVAPKTETSEPSPET